MKQRLSISMCSEFSGPSPRITRSRRRVVAFHEALDREAHLFLGQAAHFEQPGLALFELFAKMRNDAFGRAIAPISRIFP